LLAGNEDAMTLQYNGVKPSLEELSHHGVKGMKWGQHKKTQTDLKVVPHTGRTNRRPTRSEILSARQKERSLTDQIKPLDKKYGKDPKTGKLAFSKEHEALYAKLFNGDQRIVASYRTRGEKIAATILLGPIGAVKAADFNNKSRLANRSFYKN
jgi:hypothetical protein